MANNPMENKKDKVAIPMEAIPRADWEQLSEEAKEEQSNTLLKSLYGKGGEHYSTFPTIIQADKNKNPFIMEYHKHLPHTVTGQTLQDWTKNNGEIFIIPLIKGEKNGKPKTSYIITILPNKPLSMENWDLRKDSKDTLKYTTHTKLKNITLNKNHYHITNIYTNSSKAINQTKLLTKFFKLGIGQYTGYTPFGDHLKNGQYTNPLQLDILEGNYIYKEIGKNTGQPTGNIYNSIGHYLGRELHPSYKAMDLTKLIN